jgi:hypothetical protein
MTDEIETSVEHLVKLAHTLCREQPDLVQLLDDLRLVREEIERIVATSGEAVHGPPLAEQLTLLLHGCGLGRVVGNPAAVDEICADLKRLHGCVASIMATRSAGVGRPL